MNASEAAAQTDGTNERTRPVVLFDGGCPLCRREIGYYQRCRGADQIEWRDVSALAPGETAFGITQREALPAFTWSTPPVNSKAARKPLRRSSGTCRAFAGRASSPDGLSSRGCSNGSTAVFSSFAPPSNGRRGGASAMRAHLAADDRG